MTVIIENFYADNHKYSTKLIGFDMDNTIITTKSGKVFPKDKNDWKFLFDNIKSKLQSIKSTLVIFSNQLGVKKGHTSKEDIIYKIKSIQKELDIPFIFIAAIDDDINRKPRIGMFKTIEKELDIKFDKSKSLYVGDMAGREKDKDDTDRKFALNIGIMFMTPEEYFLNNEPEKFKLNGYLLDYKNKENNINFELNNKELILISGYPGSGKSTLAKKFENHKFISKDEYGTKFNKVLKEAFDNNESIVVEGLYPNNESRNKILELTEKYGYKTKLITMETPYELAVHLNKYRVLFEGYDKMIPQIVFNKYKKDYEPPNKEDWNKIIKYYPELDKKHNKYYL